MIIFMVIFLSFCSSSSFANLLHQLRGHHLVGHSSKVIEDHSRLESHLTDSNQNRQLLVDIWYPIDFEGNSPRRRFPLQEWKNLVELPKFITAYLDTFELASFESTSIQSNAEGWPVVLFSHGISAGMFEYQAYCEEVASNGFIVLGINHSYAARIVEFPDGKLIKNRIEDWGDLPREKRVELRNIEQEVWLEDTRFVLQTFFNEGLNHHLLITANTKKIFAVGHSFGGSTAIQALRFIPAIKAAINLDGVLAGREAYDVLKKPALMILASNGHEKLNQEIKELMHKSDQDGHVIVINGAIHDSFSDRGLVLAPSWTLSWVNWWQGEREDPEKIFENTINAALSFLRE